MDGRIFHIREKLVNNIQHQWTIGEMAREVELSSPHFIKLFKSNVGTSPITFLRDMRLSKARHFIESTFLQMQEIRLKVGILQDSHFTRDFKKKYGTTPTEYRKCYWDQTQCGFKIDNKA
jgi:transcriptional regulator GlxA family with amidase domain